MGPQTVSRYNYCNNNNKIIPPYYNRMNTIGRLVGHTGTIGTMTTIPGGGYIATGSRDRLIKVTNNRGSLLRLLLLLLLL